MEEPKDSPPLVLLTGSATSRGRETFCEMVDIWLSSSDEGLTSKTSREGSGNAHEPAGTVSLEIGCVKSNGDGARFRLGSTGSALFRMTTVLP